MNRRFFIIGAGLGTADTLTAEAAREVARADIVIATERLSGLRTDTVVSPAGELAERALASTGTAAVLVSGDVGFFSAAPALRERLAPYGEVVSLPGVSSMQAFCAALGVSYDDVFLCSLHGRAGSLLGPVSYHKKVFALTGGSRRANDLCRELADAGLGGVTVHLGENLGTADARIETGTAASLAAKPCGQLAVLLVEHPQARNADEPVRDSMLTRGKTPMTKEEVRWVSCAKLAVRPDDTVWDVGAGTGSVSLELARRARCGMVYAVERGEEALALLAENRKLLGGYNVCLVPGSAPETLHSLPAPDRVFIGGSGGQVRDILRIAKEKNPGVRVVVNAVTLETVQQTMDALRGLLFSKIEVVQLAASRGRETGAYTMLTAQNPVFIMSGGGGDDM